MPQGFPREWPSRLRPELFIARQAHDGSHQIAAADNADELAVAKYRQPLDAIALHQLNNAGQVGILADRYRTLRHHLFDFAAGRVSELLGKLSGTENKLNPFASPALGADLRPPQEIALRYHSDQIASRHPPPAGR